MTEKPTCEELEKRVRDLEEEVLRCRQTIEALTEKEARLSKMANQVPEMLFQFVAHSDGSFSVPYFNDQLYQYTGYKPEELMKSPAIMGKSIHSDDIELVRSKIEESLKTLNELSLDWRLIGPDNGVRWIQSKAIPQLMENGDVHWDGISVDITERKLAEEAVRESQRKYHALFDKMLDGCSLHEIICDENGKPVNYRFIDVNPAFNKLTGYRDKDIIGKTVLELIPNTDPFLIETFGKVALTGEPVSFEYYAKDTGQHHVISAYQPEERQFATIFQDVTERKKVQEELEQSQEYLKAIMKNTSDYIVIRDKDGFPALFNSSAERIAKKALGIDLNATMKPHKFLADKKEVALLDNLHKRALNGEEFKIEYSYPITDDDLRHFEITYNPILQDGKVNGFIQVARDITERRKMEEILKKSHDELEKRVKERTKELRKSNEALQEKTLDLQEVNTALKVLLERRDKDKEDIGQNVILNVKELMVPYITKLKKGTLTERQQSYLELLETGLQQIISPFSQRLSSRYLSITPGEMQVANLLKEGKTSKEIAEILNSTERAVVAHRSNLRKKLGLKKKNNLRTYLLSLQ
ncbi:MAG: PAS domain S-box protein [Desulfatiglans sp.]|jgi:PAS domain S-box-containing protein|nr:PAS domain S-box protein [Desulfatiglans sp.]